MTMASNYIKYFLCVCVCVCVYYYIAYMDDLWGSKISSNTPAWDQQSYLKT